MRKLLLPAFFAVALSFGTAQAADIVIRIAPPHARIEHRPIRPGPDYVWVGGYHRYEGNAYVWVPGRWERPPRAHAVWVAPRWHHQHDGYVFVEGYWR